MRGSNVVYVCTRCKSLDGDIWCEQCQANYCEPCHFLDPHRDEGLEHLVFVNGEPLKTCDKCGSSTIVTDDMRWGRRCASCLRAEQ